MRSSALDYQRGLIMAIMALDHCSFFLGKVHWLEYWGVPLPTYAGGLAFLTRWVTHFCAPGFTFLMGISLTLLVSSRQRANWTNAQIRWFIVQRGVLLLLLQQLLENPAWLLGLLSDPAHQGVSTPPGAGNPVFFFGVLYGLGGAMIVSALWLELASFWLLLLAASCLIVTFGVVAQATTSLLYPPLVRLLIIPGVSGLWQVNYPLLPWLGIALLGVVFGRVWQQDQLRARRLALTAGLSLVGIFGLLRAVNQGDFHPVGPGWMGFLAVTKYPPSPAFICLTLGIHSGLWWWLHQPDQGVPRHSPFDGSVIGQMLLSFGAAPLFFYVLHLYLYMGIGWLLRSGTSLPIIYLVWLAGLMAL